MAMIFNHDLKRKGYKTGEFIGKVTFNALRDNQFIGDERVNFVTARKEGEREFKKVIKADAGDRFTVRLYFHNNADPSLGREGISANTWIHLTGGAFYSDEKAWKQYGIEGHGIMGYIEWSDPEPRRVRDFCVIDTPEFTTYDYIKGSSRITTACGTQPFPDYGELIGIGRLDGVIPPGESGYVEMDYEVVKFGE